MTYRELRELNDLATTAAASLLPVTSGGATDGHGGRPETEAESIARGFIALESAGELAQRIRHDLEASKRQDVACPELHWHGYTGSPRLQPRQSPRQ